MSYSGRKVRPIETCQIRGGKGERLCGPQSKSCSVLCQSLFQLCMMGVEESYNKFCGKIEVYELIVSSQVVPILSQSVAQWWAFGKELL